MLTALGQSRVLLWSMMVIICLFVAGAIEHYRFVSGIEQLQDRGRTNLALAADRFNAQIQRFQELTVLTAAHPDIRARSEGGGDEAAARATLMRVADTTAALNMLLVRKDGTLLSSAFSQENLPGPGDAFFDRAVRGALGKGHGSDNAWHRRVFYFAAPVKAPGSTSVSAVLVTLVDIDRLEGSWRGDRLAIYFTDNTGKIFITNRSELLGAKIIGASANPKLSANGPQTLVYETSEKGGFTYWQLDWGPYVPHEALPIFIDLPNVGLKAGALPDIASVRRLALWQAGFGASIVLLLSLGFIFMAERRRVLAQSNASLEERVKARTAELQKAQADLVQAGKLSALGQLSAGLSHELNQPLMAMEQFSQNAQTYLKKGRIEEAAGNLQRIADLVTRMGRIIKNLRAFTRNESEPTTKVDFKQILDQALELSQPRLSQDGVELVTQFPTRPVWVRGGEVRLSQVVVNLINNAADAMASAPQKLLRLTLNVDHEYALLTVQDSGPGIADPEKAFDPFYSTKSDQRHSANDPGMGLGLSISYGLVQSFGGKIKGYNTDLGACFTVQLDLWKPVVGQVEKKGNTL